jgi:phosphoenolpyruvate carboxykinase (ATP)
MRLLFTYAKENFVMVALTARKRPVQTGKRHVIRLPLGRYACSAAVLTFLTVAAHFGQGAFSMTNGRVNPDQTLENTGISGLGTVHYNLLEPALIEAALRRGEGRLGKGGAFLVSTGKFTGRSPKDKFVVRTPAVENEIWWDNNAPMAPDAFDRLHADMLEHMKGGEYFVQDLYGGADAEHRLDVRVVSELAWHNLFIRHLLRRPSARSLTLRRPSSRSSTAPASRPIPNGTAAAPTR